MTAAVNARTAVSVAELQRAWSAVQAGQFRNTTARDRSASPARRDRQPSTWTPGPSERVIPVLGCSGSRGATTVALALAMAAGQDVRVVECSTVTASGLAAASTAELGLHPSGWTQGSRGGVLLERASQVLVGAGEVPVPSAPEGRVDLTILDVAWPLDQLLTCSCWLAEQVVEAEATVLVAEATVPGLRHLEAALGLLTGTRTVVAVVGPPRRRWPRSVQRSAGSSIRALDGAGLVVAVPEDRRLAVAGLDSTPLPAPLLQSAADLLQLITGHTMKGNRL